MEIPFGEMNAMSAFQRMEKDLFTYISFAKVFSEEVVFDYRSTEERTNLLVLCFRDSNGNLKLKLKILFCSTTSKSAMSHCTRGRP